MHGGVTLPKKYKEKKKKVVKMHGGVTVAKIKKKIKEAPPPTTDYKGNKGKEEKSSVARRFAIGRKFPSPETIKKTREGDPKAMDVTMGWLTKAETEEQEKLRLAREGSLPHMRAIADE